MADDPVEQLVNEFGTARGDHFAAIKEQILKTGAPAVPHLVRAYRGKKIDVWRCFETILEMSPTAYVPVLEAARDDNEEALAILGVIANYSKPLPEAISMLIDGLRSDDSMKILRCMAAILHMYPLVEVHHHNKLPLFAGATNRLLDLLGHENEHIRREAARCIAVLRPTEPDVLPILVRVVKERYLSKDCEQVHALMQAIGGHGPEAVEAIPVLMRILRSPASRWLKVEAARTLSRIGRAAAFAIPLLEEYRDQTELQFKSETKCFRRALNESIKHIEEALVPPAPKRKRRGDPYLLDLIDRMGRHDDYVASGANSTSRKAYEEARRLTDPSLVPKIGELLDARFSGQVLRHLLFVLCCVTCNTASAEGQQLILLLFSREHRRKNDLNAIIDAAARCSVKGASAHVRRLLFADNGRYALEALDYFAATKDDMAVDDIARCLRQSGKYASHCIRALGDIGSPRATPYLLETAKGELLPGERSRWEWRRWSISALGRLKAVDAVPDLMAMLSDRAYRSHRPAIVDALCMIEDERAFAAILAALKKTVDAQDFSARWSTGRRTVIVNALDYLGKIGRHEDPAVLQVVKLLQSQPNWSRLLKQERDFIRRRYGPYGQNSRT